MPVSSLLLLAASCIGIIGSLFFAIGVVRQNAEVMAQMAGTYWMSNPHQVAALAAQRADYIFGGFIGLAFVVQLGSFFIPLDSAGLSTGIARMVLWLALPATVAAFVLLHLLAAKLARHFQAQINDTIKRRTEAGTTT